MIPWINRFGKGADVGFLIGALAILPFAFYSGYGLAGYHTGPREGIIDSIVFFSLFILISAGIMIFCGFVGALLGFALQWIIRRAH